MLLVQLLEATLWALEMNGPKSRSVDANARPGEQSTVYHDLVSGSVSSALVGMKVEMRCRATMRIDAKTSFNFPHCIYHAQTKTGHRSMAV
jgi:hypothetical protein